MKEFTFKALLMGSIFGIAFGAATVYLALNAGLTVSASIPIAVLAITIGRKLFRTTILENNIIQTTGSASESIAAGVVFTLPGFLFLSTAEASSFFNYAVIFILSIFGGMFLGLVFSGINPDEYVRHIPTIVSRFSIGSGLFKCLVFALVLASVCTFKGYAARGGAKGVGRAVVSTAVMTMLVASVHTGAIMNAIAPSGPARARTPRTSANQPSQTGRARVRRIAAAAASMKIARPAMVGKKSSWSR